MKVDNLERILSENPSAKFSIENLHFEKGDNTAFAATLTIEGEVIVKVLWDNLEGLFREVHMMLIIY